MQLSRTPRRYPKSLFIIVRVVACIISLLGALNAKADLESEVQAYEAADAINPPPAGATVFVGSSSIRIWPNLPGAFPNHTVLNRGFGGSQMSDLLDYFDRLVARYQPPHIVVYEGDNDLAGGKSVDQVFLDYSNFLARVEQQLPRAKVSFIAVKPSPSRVGLMTQMQDLNARVRALAEARRHRFIDVFTPMLNGAGQPRAELFQADMLHMNAAGYAIWQQVIEPVLIAASAPVGGTFLFDFGAATTPVGFGPPPDDPVNYWNNVGAIGTATNGELQNLVTVLNERTAMGFSVVSRFNGVNEAGTVASTIYPLNATRDSLYGNTEAFNNLSNIFPSFKLTGLNTQSTVSLSFYASRGGATDNRETGYTVQGANSGFAALNVANNVDGVAVVTDIVPNDAGEITVSLAPTENNNNANHFTYLGVMKVDVVPPQTPIIFTLEPVSQRAVEGQTVTFRAAVVGAPPHFIQWFNNGTPIEGANQFSYTIPSTTLDMNGSLISVTVSNLAYSATSSNALLRVVNDTTPPELVSAISRNGQTIELTFNEAIEPTGAIFSFNYVVNEGLVEVSSVELRPDGRTVVLSLTSVISGNFSVVVNYIQDLALNVIATDSSITGNVPGPETRFYLIDFGGGNTTANGPAPDDPVNYWNNVTATIGSSDSGQLTGLITADNSPSTVNLIMVRRFNGANENGTTLATAPFPTDATRDSLFGNTETFSTLSNIFPKFKLTGLLTDLGYTFTFFASRTGVGDNRTTGYTVEGATTGFAALNAANNVTNVAVVSGIRPTPEGEIAISLAPTAANNNANHFTYLGVLKIQPILVQPTFTVKTIANGRITLDWVDGGRIESAPTVLGPWTPIEPQPAAPYSEDLVPGQNRFYRLVKP